MTLPRLRQAVLAAHDLDATCAALERELGVRNPFHDHGVGHFGLRNAVYAAGDTFIEVVSPVADGTAVGRHLARTGGDSGYMCMFEVADAPAVRQRLTDAGVRVVHESEHDDIVDLHLHPKDVPGAIVAVDVCTPPGSWRWGGPAWEAAVPAYGPGGLRGLTVAVTEPAAVAARWAQVLGLAHDGADEIAVDGGRQQLRYLTAQDGAQRIVEVAVDVPPGTATGDVTIAGVRFRRSTEEEH